MKQVRNLIACLLMAVLNLSFADYYNVPDQLDDEPNPVYSTDLEKRAKKDLDAQCQLALCYYNGYGVAQNKEKALKLWEKAAKKRHGDSYYWLGKHYWSIDQWIGLDYYNLGAACGSAKAQYEMGNIYNIGYHLGRRVAEAEEMWRKAAMQGHAEAQYNLARHLSDNQRENGHEVVEWYRKAAVQGHAKAQYELGSCYRYGKGVAKDDNEAIKWYRKAVENGHEYSKNALNELLAKVGESRESESVIVRQYREAAERGEAQAQFNLGLAYFKGNGVKENKGESEQWFKKASDQGHVQALRYLGLCYLLHRTDKDEEIAVGFLKKAAEQGDAEAKYHLGDIYHYKDSPPYRSARYYEEAANQGYAPAQVAFARLCVRGWGVNQNTDEGLKWYQKAIDQEYMPAFVALGDLYEEGKYVNQDLNEAISWYRKAEAQGSKEATKYIARCQEQIEERKRQERQRQIDEQNRRTQMTTNSNNNNGSSSGGNTGGNNYIPPAPQVPLDNTCFSCGGTGKCSTCYGRGISPNHAPGIIASCGACGGTGRCTGCRGRGYM